MHKLVRIYYRMCRGISLSKDVSLQGDLSCIKDSQVKFGTGAKVSIGKNVSIRNSKIEVTGGELIIEDGVNISDYEITVTRGCHLHIGANCYLERGDNWRNPFIILWDASSLKVANNNRLRCDVMCRFGGQCEIGEYNCLNERTEIRCDESVTIGAFNMVSYNCRIWDTNTHAFYADDSRSRMTIETFPNIGAENDKPSTKPVVIGNDCLLGEECVILKGSTVGNKCIVGVHSVVAGVSIPAETMAVGNPAVVKNLDTRTE